MDGCIRHDQGGTCKKKKIKKNLLRRTNMGSTKKKKKGHNKPFSKDCKHPFTISLSSSFHSREKIFQAKSQSCIIFASSISQQSRSLNLESTSWIFFPSSWARKHVKTDSRKFSKSHVRMSHFFAFLSPFTEKLLTPRADVVKMDIVEANDIIRGDSGIPKVTVRKRRIFQTHLVYSQNQRQFWKCDQFFIQKKKNFLLWLSIWFF